MTVRGKYTLFVTVTLFILYCHCSQSQSLPLIEGDVFSVTDLPPGHDWCGTTFIIYDGKTPPFLNRAARAAFGVNERRIRNIDADLFKKIITIYPIGGFITADGAPLQTLPGTYSFWLSAPAGFNLYMDCRVKAFVEDPEFSVAIGAEELLQDVLILDVDRVNIERLNVAALQLDEQIKARVIAYKFIDLGQDVSSLLLENGWMAINQKDIFLAPDSSAFAVIESPTKCVIGDEVSLEMWRTAVAQNEWLREQEGMSAVCSLLDHSDEPLSVLYAFQSSTVAAQGTAQTIGSAFAYLAGVGGLGDLFTMLGSVVGIASSYCRIDSNNLVMSAYGIMESDMGAKSAAEMIGLIKGMGKFTASLDPGSPDSQRMLAEAKRMSCETSENIAIARMTVSFDELKK